MRSPGGKLTRIVCGVDPPSCVVARPLKDLASSYTPLDGGSGHTLPHGEAKVSREAPMLEPSPSLGTFARGMAGTSLTGCLVPRLRVRVESCDDAESAPNDYTTELVIYKCKCF